MSDGLTSLTESYSVQSPDRITYGIGSIDELGGFAEDRDVESALVVTDADIVDAGVTDPVLETLEAAGVDVDVFDDVKPEPKLKMAEGAADRLSGGGHDVVVGVGGGSSLDTAKFASVLAEHDVPAREMIGMGNVSGPGRPLALLPTTAGTGSEVTHIGVFSDEQDEGNKKVVYSEHLFADLAIVDPALTESLPAPVAAATGLDALTHAIESYVTVLRTPVSDMFARRAIELIADNLREAVHQGPNNDEARYNMAIAATIAGQAFVNSGLGAVHALTYPLGMRYGIGHGKANAMLLPHVMAYNLPAEPDRFVEVARLMGATPTGATPRERAEASVDAVLELTEDVGIPTRIGSIDGLEPEEFDEFAEIAFTYSEHNIDRNPRDLDREDVVAIYENAY